MYAHFYTYNIYICSLSIRIRSAPFGACSTCKPSLGPNKAKTRGGKMSGIGPVGLPLHFVFCTPKPGG